MRVLNPARLAENIARVAQEDFADQKVFGSAYYVSQGEDLVFQKCFGGTTPSGETPVTDKTVFRLASMSKPITAFAALLLIDRGLLSPDDPVEKYLPAFRDIHVIKPQKDGTLRDDGVTPVPILVSQLLTHSSGILCESPPKAKHMTDRDKENVQTMVDYVLRSGLDYVPGTYTQYSPYAAFDVMVSVIEHISGMDFLSFLQKELFLPCGMTDTTFAPSETQIDRMIAMHRKDENGKSAIHETPRYVIFGNFPFTHYLGGGGLVSTLDDYAKFAHLLLNEGRCDGGQLIRPETMRLMRTVQPYIQKIMPGGQQWGLGVRVITNEKYKLLPVGCFGWSGAYGTHFWIDPDNKITAVFMKNSTFDGGAGNESAKKFEKAVTDALE